MPTADERGTATSAKRHRPDGRPFRTVAVVLNYKTPELALRAVASVASELDPSQDLALVVDNHSPDDSVEKLRAGIEQLDASHVHLVVSPHNGGFAAGNNVGIRAAEAETYLLLNSDTLVRPQAVARLRAALSSRADVGLCSPQLCFEDGTPQVSCFRLHSPLSELIQGSQTGPVTRLLARWNVPLGVQHRQIEVEWTSFACVMIKREVLRRVGLLDEGYFMYFEDADYCRRAREFGYRVLHEPAAQVVHLRGKSSPVKEATRLRQPRPGYYYAARHRFFRLAYGPWGPLCANALWTLGRGIALPREWIKWKKPHAVRGEFVHNWTGERLWPPAKRSEVSGGGS